MAHQARSPPPRDYHRGNVNGKASTHENAYPQQSYGDMNSHSDYNSASAYGYEEYGSNPYSDQHPQDDYSYHNEYNEQASGYYNLNQNYTTLGGNSLSKEDNSYARDASQPYTTAAPSDNERQSAYPYQDHTEVHDGNQKQYGRGSAQHNSGRNRGPLPSFESVRRKGHNQPPGIATRVDGQIRREYGTTHAQPQSLPTSPLENKYQQNLDQNGSDSDRWADQHQHLASENNEQRSGPAPFTGGVVDEGSATTGFDFSVSYPSRGELNSQDHNRPPMRRGASDNRDDAYFRKNESRTFHETSTRSAAVDVSEDDEMPNFQNAQSGSQDPASGAQASAFAPYRPVDSNDHKQDWYGDLEQERIDGPYSPREPTSMRITRPDERRGYEQSGFDEARRSPNRRSPPSIRAGPPRQPQDQSLPKGDPNRRPRQNNDGPSRSRTMDGYEPKRDRQPLPEPGYRYGAPPGAMRGPPRAPMEQQRRPPRFDGPVREPRGPGRLSNGSDPDRREMPFRERRPGQQGQGRGGLDDQRNYRDAYNGQSSRRGGPYGQGPGPIAGGYPPRPRTAGDARERRPHRMDDQTSAYEGRSSEGDVRRPPAPTRPGLSSPNGSGGQPARPPPVRHYATDTSNGGLPNVQDKRKSAPITQPELNHLQDLARNNPSDQKLQLKLARKLVEAISVLADEGGRADQKTCEKNRERFAVDAHKILKSLVSQNNPEAMFHLAEYYGEGVLGLAADSKEAFNLYQSAAKMNHAVAAYRTAVCCEIGPEEGGGTRQDFQKAVQWYHRAASLGDVGANYKMGIILLDGLLGQARNPSEAVVHLKRAAERADEEHPHALYELARLHESREYNSITPYDEPLALKEFTQAAKLGHRNSQFRLGKAFEYGLLTCPIDARNSIYWYTKAAAQGQHESELALSGWYLTGSEGILDQSDTEAYLWARKAAMGEPPLPKAMFAMGYFTEVGIGCPRSLDEAKRWYGRAASHNFQKAQERLEELKRGGTGAQRDRERLSRSNPKQNENCSIM